MRFFHLFAIGAMLFLSACKKEQPKMNNGLAGCDCAKEVSADFTIEEVAGYGLSTQINTETDTIFAQKNVRFYAQEKDANYKWIIGGETLSTREVYRYFNEFLVGQTIVVTLILEKQANKICFPNDDGKDTLTKSFYITNAFNNTNDLLNGPQPKIEGWYRFKEVSKPDSVDINIAFGPLPPVLSLDMKITNFNGQGGDLQFSFGTYNYLQLYFDGPNYGICYWQRKMSGEYILSLKRNPGTNGPSFYYVGRKLT